MVQTKLDRIKYFQRYKIEKVLKRNYFEECREEMNFKLDLIIILLGEIRDEMVAANRKFEVHTKNIVRLNGKVFGKKELIA